MDLSKGIPQGRPSKKMPKPFRRPGIEVTRGLRKEWQWVAPDKVRAGDIIAGRGAVRGRARTDVQNDDGIWLVWILAGEAENPFPVPGTEQLWVFREVEGVADGV